MNKQCPLLCLLLLMFTAGWIAGTEESMKWDTVTFAFQMKEKDETKEVQVRVRLPNKGTSMPIRGIMRDNDSFMEVAHKHNLAVISLYDEGKDRGPSLKLLAETAKACKRPEIEFAGAVGIGCSAGGRRAAQWAGFNHERSLAVFLDHSFAGSVNDKPNYDYVNLPIVPGVPMCFTETHDNMHQNIDRRACHYNWCTSAFRDYKQPCTASIHFVPSNHCQVLSRELQAVWLDEALELRIPKDIPVGKPYKLTPVTIQRGGLIKADLSKNDKGRTYHDNIVIGPAKSVAKPKDWNFWVPGPRTAAKYIEWAEKNGSKISLNKADLIPAP